MAYEIEFRNGQSRLTRSVDVSPMGFWDGGELPWAVPCAPDTRDSSPICCLGFEQANYHGSLQEDLWVLGDNDDDPSVFLLWASGSGDQLADSVSRLFLVASASANQTYRIAEEMAIEDWWRELAGIALVAAYFVECAERESDIDDLYQGACALDGWPGDLLDWDSFLKSVKEGRPIEFRVPAQPE